MMRNHKPERLHFLQELWNAELLEDNFVSYLGQVNSSVVHGRTPRTIESILKPTYGVDTEYEFIANSKFAEWCEFSLPLEILGDTSKIFENNTDFYTTGNLEWYKHTQYSVVLETYWARTEFLTEKNYLNDFINNKDWIFGLLNKEKDTEFKNCISKLFQT